MPKYLQDSSFSAFTKTEELFVDPAVSLIEQEPTISSFTDSRPQSLPHQILLILIYNQKLIYSSY
jgi:hypothetical protein